MKSKTKENNLDLIDPRRFLYRGNPIVKVFVLGILLVILGLILSIALIIAIGSLIVLFYLIYLIVWLSLKLK